MRRWFWGHSLYLVKKAPPAMQFVEAILAAGNFWYIRAFILSQHTQPTKAPFEMYFGFIINKACVHITRKLTFRRWDAHSLFASSMALFLWAVKASSASLPLHAIYLVDGFRALWFQGMIITFASPAELALKAVSISDIGCTAHNNTRDILSPQKATQK